MTKIIVNIKGLDRSIEDVKADKRNIEKGLTEIADRIRDRLRQEIDGGRHRSNSSPGTLSKAITVTRLSRDKETLFVGVGNIDKMFKEAPYWFVLNYGAHWPGSKGAAVAGNTGAPFIPGPVKGSFDGQPPIAGAVGSAELNADGQFWITPKTFRPVRYIDKTDSWLAVFWNKFWLDKIR